MTAGVSLTEVLTLRYRDIAVALICLLIALASSSAASPKAEAAESIEAPAAHVVVLHGLGRSSKSTWLLSHRLETLGFYVHNLDYASTERAPSELVDDLRAEISNCCAKANAGSGVPIHFVTHSLGGILVRAFLAKHRPVSLGRVVMLSPPNQGTELVDRFADHPLFRWATGPIAQELGTQSSSLPVRLGPANFELGIITGNRSLNPVASWMITGADDGVVAVDSARLEGMADFLVVPKTHTFIMNSSEVTDEIVHFLNHGAFSHGANTNWRAAPERPVDSELPES